MLALKIFGAVVLTVLAIFVIGGLILPSDYHVERTVLIEASPELVHAYVGDLQQWEAWTPWMEVDPTIEVSYGETTSGVGAHQDWIGESGSGELTFTEWSPQRGVVYDMSFEEGEYESVGRILYEASEGGTLITWSMDGDSGMNLIGRWFGLFMDGMVGKDFQNGLDKLKLVVESEA